eukprot:SAG11_NODE_2859_length_2899_cov_4.249643_2_plen_50_part_00
MPGVTDLAALVEAAGISVDDICNADDEDLKELFKEHAIKVCHGLVLSLL